MSLSVPGSPSFSASMTGPSSIPSVSPSLPLSLPPTPHSTIPLSSTIILLSSIIPLPSSVTGIPSPTGILNGTGSSNTTSVFNSTNPYNSSSSSNTTSFNFAPAYDPAAPSTFVFLADPQQWRSDNDPSPGYRLNSCSSLNIALNTLDGANYPTGFNISVAGQPIGSINAVFFGGDLCQTGGDYSSDDQFTYKPPTFRGGSELRKVRALYETNFPIDNGVTKLKYDPKYFGLGNHDIQSNFHPAIGWYKGRWSGDFSLPPNFWRYQMWNYITQMHTGYHQLLLPDSNPVYGIPWQNIDSDTGEGTFSYEDHSLNYVVDMGPFDVFQLHRYGGDSDDDRQSGVGWLEGRLEERGPTRPIIIVQHYLFSQTSDTNGSITPAWTSAQRNALLDILSPYNIVAFLVGHDHSVGPLPNWIPVPWNNATRSVPEIRPGAAFNQNAALVRVTPSNMDVLYGTANNGQLTWTSGQNFTVAFANQIWEEVADWNDNYFGKLGSIYVDTRVLRAPPGKVIVSAGLARTVSPPDPDNRLTWSLITAYANGTAPEVVNVTGDAGSNNFPNTGGMSKIYVDLSPVACPPGSAAIGVFFWQKNNRVAPGLVVRNIATGVESNVTNTAWEDYFPTGGDGSSNIYADTNMVARPNRTDVPATLQMGGVALYQKGGNRVALKVLYK
ncbi:hypothetical protein BC834DRAFT_975203 [Gloeopeniophorella convolvens]|nr:hypothetical protein BC834DRAFT_975203 [Gloeopeniophorella convolvens]